MSFQSIYKVVFRRNSVFVGTVFLGALIFQTSFDVGINKFWTSYNRGKLWEDVKYKLENSGEEEE
ncbi:cytochrome b-c1 complex subunit 9, mitochondrial [Monosporozyma servazzii]